MTPAALIYTSALLGLFVLAGGGYGGLYAAGRIWARPGLVHAGYASYGAAALIVLAICLVTPLAPLWKTFVVMSALVYAAIPPITWRYLEKLHQAA